MIGKLLLYYNFAHFLIIYLFDLKSGIISYTSYILLIYLANSYY